MGRDSHLDAERALEELRSRSSLELELDRPSAHSAENSPSAEPEGDERIVGLGEFGAEARFEAGGERLPLYVIGRSMFETDTVPSDWPAKARDLQNEAAPSQYCACVSP